MQVFGQAHRRARRRSRAILTAAVVIGIAAVGCSPRGRAAEDPPLRSSAPADRIVYEDSLAIGVNEVAATEMRAAMRARYRLRPDRRFVLAVADAHHVLTGEPISIVRVQRRAGKWLVSYKGRDAGVIDDVPTYESAAAFLDAWVARIVSERKLELPSRRDSTAAALDRLVAEYTPDRLFETLRIADGRWSKTETRSTALLAPVARSIVGLVMQGLDRAEAGDILAARAFAYVSLARTVSSDHATDADALLAWLFGYREAAAALASSLPSNNAVRQLATGALNQLGRAASDSVGSRIAKVAYLRSLAKIGGRRAWTGAVADLHVDLDGDPEIAATGLLLEDFELSAELPALIEKAELARLDPSATRVTSGGQLRVRLASYSASARPGEEGIPNPARTLPQLDARARAIAPTLVGPALDTAVFAAYHRSLLHSAYLTYGLFHLELRASYPEAVAFGRMFEGLDSTTADGEFGSWYARLASTYAANGDRMRLIDDLARFRTLSGQVLVRTFSALSERVKPGDPRRMRMTRLLGERLDTRPSQRAHFAGVARSELLDPVIVARLYGAKSSALVGSEPGMAVWLASTYRDTTALRAVLNDTSVNAWTRGAALGWLAEHAGLPAAEQRDYFHRIIAQDPGNWKVRERYISFLCANQEYAAAEQEARDYIRFDRAGDGFDLIAATVSIGNTLMARGRYREAYAALAPVVATYQESAMLAGVQALMGTGRLDAAAALANEIVRRYPDSNLGRAARLEVWWRQGKNHEIAEELRANEWLVGDDAVAGAFIHAFEHAKDGDAGRAAYALVQEGTSGQAMYGLGMAAHRVGNDDIAFELASRGTDPNPLAAVVQATWASRFLANSHGQDAAAQWLREHLPMPLTDDLAFFLADAGHDELLWAWTPDDSRDEGRYTWLVRALGAARSGLASSPHRAELQAHFAAPNANPYYMMGRHMVGLEREDAMLALATTLHRKCEVAFWLGARARAEGRIADAVDWFRVAVETAQMRDGEYYWALRALAEISNDPRGLEIRSAVPGMP